MNSRIAVTVYNLVAVYAYRAMASRRQGNERAT